MRVVRAHPDPDSPQERAFRHRDVRYLADALMLHDDARLVALARQAVISPTPLTRDELRIRLGPEAEETLLDSAEIIVKAGSHIATEPDDDERGRRKGALLERYVHEMVRSRRNRTTIREARVELDLHPHCGRDQTKPKEVVVDDDPFEVYECKFGNKRVNQDDINELGDVFLTARSAGRDPRPCLATMGTERELRAGLAASRVVLDEVLYFSDRTDLHRLRARPPSRRLR